MTDRHDISDVPLLLHLTELLEVSCDRPAAVRHLESSLREHPADEADATAFALACRRAGLRVVPFNETLDPAIGRASRQTPIVARVRRDTGRSWAIVVDWRGSRVLALVYPEEQPRWMTRRELAVQLGARDGGDRLDWLMIHAAAPCAPAEATAEGTGSSTSPLSYANSTRIVSHASSPPVPTPSSLKVKATRVSSFPKGSLGASRK